MISPPALANERHLELDDRESSPNASLATFDAGTGFPATRVFGNRANSEPSRPGCVSVIIPIYNEAEHVERLLAAVHASPVFKEIIVVDDGSTDRTREKLMSMANKEAITLILHEANFGKGAAIRTAMQFARGEYVLIQDSDLEYDPRDHPALLQPLREGRANIVYGVRPDRPERGLRFFLGAKFLTALTNLLYGVRIHDEMTCYKAFRRSLLDRIRLESEGFEFCSEVTAKICRLGERIHEVPISYTPRTKAEGKKIRYSDGWKGTLTLVRCRFTSKQKLYQRSCETENQMTFPKEQVRSGLHFTVPFTTTVTTHRKDRKMPPAAL